MTFEEYLATQTTVEQRLALHEAICTLFAVDAIRDITLSQLNDVLAEELDIEHELFLSLMDEEELADWENRIALEELLAV